MGKVDDSLERQRRAGKAGETEQQREKDER